MLYIKGQRVRQEEVRWKVKVKCTLVQVRRFCRGCTAHRWSRGVALAFHDCGTRRGWVVSSTPRPLFTPGKDPVPIVQEAGWAPWPVRTGAENLAHTGIRSPDSPTRSQSLYGLQVREGKAELLFYSEDTGSRLLRNLLFYLPSKHNITCNKILFC